MENAKCSAEHGKIIICSKNCGENEENLAIFTVILMAAFGAKNVHSAPTVDVRHICVKGLSSHDLTCVYVGCFTAQLSKRAL